MICAVVCEAYVPKVTLPLKTIVPVVVPPALPAKKTLLPLTLELPSVAAPVNVIMAGELPTKNCAWLAVPVFPASAVVVPATVIVPEQMIMASSVQLLVFASVKDKLTKILNFPPLAVVF